MDLLAWFAGAYLVVASTKLVAGYVATRLEAGIVEGLVRDIRVELFRCLTARTPGAAGERSVGDRLAHLSSDVERTESLIFTAPIALVADLAAALFFSIILFHLNWKLALAALLVVPLLAVSSWRYAPRVRRAARVARWRGSRWFDAAEERLGALPLIHSFAAQERETARFAAVCDANRKAELATVSVQAWLTLVIELAAMLGGFAVVALGAIEIRNGALSVGALVAFLGAVGSLYAPARGLARAYGRFQRAAAGAQRVATLLDAPVPYPEAANARRLAKVAGAIEFRDIRFSYRPDEEVLRGVSFRIEPGETVAIVGASGSGKSTLVRLLLRFADPQSGAVLVDGIDTRELSFASLRAAMAVVFQDPLLLKGTVADNIRYGVPGASEREITDAARAACADGFVASLTSGYAAAVGSRGDRLSGGQRQRLALARALLRDAPILVLDEATAAVDSESEELIHEAVLNLAGQRTILMIGHRLSAIRHADRVVVLDQGRVVETGTPAELERRSGRYRALFAAQIEDASAAA